MEGKELTRPLTRPVYTNRHTSITSSVSLDAIGKQFKAFMETLPEPTADMLQKGVNFSPGRSPPSAAPGSRFH